MRRIAATVIVWSLALVGCDGAAGTEAEPAPRKPSVGDEAVLGVGNEAARVCAHIFEVTAAELEPDAELSDEGTANVMRKCIVDVDRERDLIGDAMFARQTKCIMASTKMEDMLKCDAR